MTSENQPVWTGLTDDARKGFQEVWYLKLNDPDGSKALWLRFTLLSSGNGFKRVAETWAIFFSRKDNSDVAKIALKQTHEISAFVPAEGGTGVRIGECELVDGATRGAIQAKGHTIRWDLRVAPGAAVSFNLVPDLLARAGIVKNRVRTVGEDLRFSGSCEVDGERFEFAQAPGMQGHLSGPKNGHSWVWGHCNSFVNEQGAPAAFIFEGLTARARLGPFPSPRLSAFLFVYQGQEYRFNSLWDAIRCRSRHSLTGWEFQADRGDLSFRGKASSEHRDFAGLTYEDTDGSFLYCNNSKLSQMTVLVYRRGKLETTLKARGTAAFEVVARQKNPYVPLLV
jgi:hypothetical protein